MGTTNNGSEKDITIKLDEMKQVLRERKMQPVFFIGSGLSRRYLDSPNWENLLMKIAEEVECNYEELKKRYEPEYDRIAQELEYYCFRHAKKEDIDKKKRKSILRDLIADIFINYVKDYKKKKIIEENSSLNQDIYTQMNKITNIDKMNEVTKIEKVAEEYQNIYEKIKLCSDNFNKYIEINELKKVYPKAIITTNYDTMLEDIIFENRCNIHIGQEGILSSMDESDEIDLYKIHGCVTKPDTIIITKDDYDDFEEKGKYLYSKIFTIFCEYPIIFIGYSISDRNIKNILTAMMEIMTENQKVDFLKRIWVVDFVKYKENESVVEKEIELFNGKNIKVTCFCLMDYKQLYQAINEITNQPFGELKFAISENVIELLIAPLYQQQDKLKVVTRELLQNAFDACKRKDINAKICIKISSDSDEYQYLEVRDNGIGMSLPEIKDNFLTVGKSDKNNNKEGLVGKYGIGILSIFLIGEYAEVYTKKKDRAILSLKIYIKNDKKQVEWLDEIPSEIKEISEDSFTIVKIRLNTTFTEETMDFCMKQLGLSTYVVDSENCITVEYMKDKTEVLSVDRKDWFLHIPPNIDIYQMRWLNIEDSELNEKEKQLKKLLDQQGVIFYNDMISPVKFETAAYRQLKNINIPFIMLNYKDVGAVEEDIKSDLSRSNVQISGQVMKTIASGIYQLEIDKMMEVLRDSKIQFENQEIDNWDLLKIIKRNCHIINSNVDVLLHEGKLLFSKLICTKYINIWGDEMSAKQVIKGFQEPILYSNINMMHRSSFSDILFNEDLLSSEKMICVSVSYLDTYIYNATNSHNGLKKGALIKVLNHLGIKNMNMNDSSEQIWNYIWLNKQNIKAAYDQMADKGILWFDKSVTLNIEEDIRNLIVFETQYLDNFLDELFYQMLRKKLSENSFDNMILLSK
jgi:hypothetical protein